MPFCFKAMTFRGLKWKKSKALNIEFWVVSTHAIKIWEWELVNLDYKMI